MTKLELIKTTQQNTGFKKPITTEICEAFLDAMRNSLIAGKSIYIRGFGTFEIKERKQKIGHIMTKGSKTTSGKVFIPKRNVVLFHQSDEYTIKQPE